MIGWIVFSCASFWIIPGTWSYKADYTGCTVYRINPASGHTMKVLQQLYNASLMDQFDDTSPNIEFWHPPHWHSRQTTLHICADKKPIYEFLIQRLEMPYKVQMHDLQRAIDREWHELSQRVQFLRDDEPQSFTRDQYHTLHEIYAFLDAVAASSPKNAEVRTVGMSVKKKPIKVIKISSGSDCQKPAVWFDCGIHAREWISPATCLWMIYQLMYVGTDADAKALKSMYDWHFMPVVNPDGYDHSWHADRLWRKNLSQNRRCSGVDLNRNFDLDWRGGRTSSSSPCSNTYRGSRPFSEPEAAAIRNEVLRLKDDLKLYMTIHSYGQMWLYPYSYKRSPSVHQTDLHKLTQKAVQAIQNVNGTVYKYGPSGPTLYPASGTSDDWVHDAAAVKYAFTVELRDKGNHGFMLPANQILATAEETWQGIVATLHGIAEEYKIPAEADFTDASEEIPSSY